MKIWLIEPQTLQAMRAARAQGYQPTLEERAHFELAMRERYAALPDGQPRNMRVAGSTAQIDIEGVLTEKPDCIAMIFGGGNTTYESIRKSLALAEADPNVKNILLNVASPGGEVEGLFETFAALDTTTKPVSVRASFAASAAYGLAAVAGHIEATTPASTFGSIGVAAMFVVSEEIVDIASTEAPNKRPDVSTDEGVAVVREYLDQLHDQFAAAIAAGRAATTKNDVDVATVNAEFGRGGLLIAAAAKKRGMIDRVAAQPKKKYAAGKGASSDDQTAPGDAPQTDVPAASGGAQEKETTMAMTEDELREKHPELYAAVLGKGEAKERKRVNAHLKMGKSHDAMDVAMSAIASGASVLDEEVHADYMSAAKNRKAQNDRQADSDDAGVALGGVKPPAGDGGKDNSDLVAAAMGLPPPKAGK